MKKLVFLTGAGVSAESGLRTFRDSDGLWENYSVADVASHEGWLANPTLVTEFYNARRRETLEKLPNEAHRLIQSLEAQFDVSVITQNIDNLHEQAGTKHIIHLHGEVMKMCSSRNVEDSTCWLQLTPDSCEVAPGTLAADGSLLRPYVVFFGEAVPKIEEAALLTQTADIFVVVGTSLNVYPAAGLLHYVRRGVPIYVIDPKPVPTQGLHVHHIMKKASEGMRELCEQLMPLS